VDGLGQTGSDRSGEHAEDGVLSGRSAPWAKESWSSAGSALEPNFQPINSWNGPAVDRRGIDALTGKDALDDTGASTIVQPKFTPLSLAPADVAPANARHPTGDESAQRAADFAREVSFDDPTPPQGMPVISGPPPAAWAPPAPDPMPASGLSLGQRFGMAFGEELHRSPPTEFNGFPADEPGPRATAVLDELPRRNPGESEVPPGDQGPVAPAIEDKYQLSRIASHLRRDDVPEDRPDGFDVEAVLRAVRSVAGVREATLRTTPTGAHHLRLDLAEGADPGTISRMVARMLEEQMGLDAAPAGLPSPRERSDPSPVVLPGPRLEPGSAEPLAAEEAAEPASDPPHLMPVREPRRRHPVSVPRRPPPELRPSERAAATWRAAFESDQPGSPPPPLPTDREQGPRAVIDHVQTSTFGLDATVEVRLAAGERVASGVASGPAVDGYVLRLCAAATAAAIDDLLSEGTSTGETARCFVEHAALVPMGSCDVAVVVVLLVCGSWVEQLAGSALVSGDQRRAVVRATLSAVNRRLAALLP
jgi:hypothetical protein